MRSELLQNVYSGGAIACGPSVQTPFDFISIGIGGFGGTAEEHIFHSYPTSYSFTPSGLEGTAITLGVGVSANPSPISGHGTAANFVPLNELYSSPSDLTTEQDKDRHFLKYVWFEDSMSSIPDKFFISYLILTNETEPDNE